MLRDRDFGPIFIGNCFCFVLSLLFYKKVTRILIRRTNNWLLFHWLAETRKETLFISLSVENDLVH